MSDDDEQASSPKKKVLGRGLGELLEQHDTDLPFLDAYGPDTGDAEAGDADDSDTTTEELLEVLARSLRTLLEGESVEIDDGSIELANRLVATCADDGIALSIQAVSQPLPLVPSDLNQSGFALGELAADRSHASVTIVRWGIDSRRLVERLCEHWTLGP